ALDRDAAAIDDAACEGRASLQEDAVPVRADRELAIEIAVVVGVLHGVIFLQPNGAGIGDRERAGLAALQQDAGGVVGVVRGEHAAALNRDVVARINRDRCLAGVHGDRTAAADSNV